MLLDITSEQRGLIQAWSNALDNVQKYHLSINLSKNNDEKAKCQEQISAWKAKAESLQSNLAPIMLVLKQHLPNR
ncbi:hypothetical protein [Spiroplasma endosymbiont of Nebria brevicollis]|uniref:hypothetical protein n=1 Tax=Spiroplasma endosymbiont of Nebria brevicollis TaxID=3066284 RepID=UPI00313CE769